MTNPICGCFVYGIAVDQRTCTGHGEFAESQVLQKHFVEMRDNEWIEEFPPLFLTEKEAWAWINLKERYPAMKPVKLRLLLPPSIYKTLQEFGKPEE